MSEELVVFYKALADANRLKIVGLLARQSYSVEELAALLHLRSSTISHHLAKLSEVGLVSARGESYYTVYRLEEKALEEKARRLLSREDFSETSSNIDLGTYDRRVIAAYSRKDGSLKTIPAHRKKLEAVLRLISQAFDLDKHYSEKKVNEILGRFHADTATLRREMVGCGLMKRAGGGGDYWRTEAG